MNGATLTWYAEVSGMLLLLTMKLSRSASRHTRLVHSHALRHPTLTCQVEEQLRQRIVIKVSGSDHLCIGGIRLVDILHLNVDLERQAIVTE
jgi:hypothetical protein